MLRALAKAFPVPGNGPGEFIHAFIFRGHGADNFRFPPVAFGSKLEHRLQFRLQAVRSIAVRFIQNKNVGNLHQAGLHILHVVAHARHEQDERAIRKPHDVHFILADAHGFDQHKFVPGGVQNQRHIARRARDDSLEVLEVGREVEREAAEKPARRHRADENSRVARVALHPYAVAQDRAARVRAGGIDRDNSDVISLPSIASGQPIDERALPSSGRARHADHKGFPGIREKSPQ